MKHEHKEIIFAWLNGIECEFYNERMYLWCDIDELSDFDSYAKVRIKPEPQEHSQLKHKEGINKSLESLILEQDKTITELSTKLIYANRTIENLTVEPPKEKEQEPVLWVHIKTLDRTIRQGTSGAFWHKFPDGYGLSKEEFIPLYTQPLKKASEK